ncbi:hypothetical protein [Burkholderia ubonensis]|uniref:hypothetical protein n=1 Tax=Burkholderia ubonensis TaxID=101571 RepID=UPI000A82E3D7|nr:hypothetical protein [Burkholderia ubonensis]
MTVVDILIALLAFLVGFVVREFLPGYFRKKGENFATKEDIAEITDLQKAVEHRFNELIENSKQRHALRLAALDRRLAAHQEAFSLWRELLSNTHGEKVGPVVLRCQEWWERNCLYLEPNVRDAFVRAYSAAHSHHSYTQARADSNIIEENWRDISIFPKVLFDAIQLPPIRQVDAENVISDPRG